MRKTTSRMTDMQSLSLFALLVAAASALDIVKKDDKVSYRCSLHPSDHGIVLKERKFPIYLCNSDDGDRLIFASESFIDDKIDAKVDKETVLKLRDLTVVTRPKRQFGGGFGAAGAQSSAQAFGGGGGYGGGYGPGGYGGYPHGGGGFGGGLASSQSSALAGGGGLYG